MIFVDFENIREINLDQIQNKPVTISIALGKRHSSLPRDLVHQILLFPDQVQVIETECSGKNALDFILAYQIGVHSAKTPKTIFHLLSRDQGFDALVDHLRSHKINITRYESFGHIPILSEIPPPLLNQDKKNISPPLNENSSTLKISLESRERIQDMTERFSRNLSRPKRKQTLLSHIHIRYGKKLLEKELQEILQGLIFNHVLEITAEDTVKYHC